MRNVGYSTEGAMLTADGCVLAIGAPTSDACCPPDICNIDPCGVMCNFIELLPNGPLWDRAKAEGMSRYAQNCMGPACIPDAGDSCASLVDYAAYSGYRLATLINGPLWGAIREANPETAVETLDSWLDLFGWADPWGTVCRDPRLGPSPLECTDWEPTLDNCDANFSPLYVPDLPDALDAAVKRGVVRSLSRLQMAPIKNLCGINWVIEPLSAVLRPSATVADSCCTGMRWEICNNTDTIDAVPGMLCSDRDRGRIPSYFDMRSLRFNTVTGVCEPQGDDTVRIWPAVMMAQAIALSMIPSKDCETPIIRCEGS